MITSKYVSEKEAVLCFQTLKMVKKEIPLKGVRQRDTHFISMFLKCKKIFVHEIRVSPDVTVKRVHSGSMWNIQQLSFEDVLNRDILQALILRYVLPAVGTGIKIEETYQLKSCYAGRNPCYTFLLKGI